jgi:hypothetical protein
MESVRSRLSAIGVIFVNNSLLAMTGAKDSWRALRCGEHNYITSVKPDHALALGALAG